MSTENTITTAAADVAAAPNATLDELVGTTTNTAILPEPDAHAYDEIATGDADPLILGGHKFTSRFILGSGRYDLNLIKATIENAGTQIVTMALRRCRTTENNLLDYIPKGITMLPNTSGARNAEEAVRIARLAREVCQTDFVKVEIEHEAKYLLPDNEETIKATEKLAKEGFVVMPYMFPDPIAAKRLEDAGAACVMPLGAMIGSNKGLRARDFIEVIIKNSNVPVIIDAGIGRPSQAAEAMEMGADAVMAYTAIASAGNIPLMARAFKNAIEAGREACPAWERLRRTTPSRPARRTRPTTSADSRRFRTIRALTFRTVLLRLHDEGRWKRTFSQGFHRPSFVGCATRSATRACHAYRSDRQYVYFPRAAFKSRFWNRSCSRQ